MRTGKGTAVLVALACTGCACPHLPQSTPSTDLRHTPPQAAPGADGGHAPVTVTGAFAAVDLAFDRKWWRSPGPELAWGEGYAVGVETGLPDTSTSDGTFTLAAEYARTEHAELRSGTRTELHMATLLVGSRPWEFGGENFALGPRLCAGFGAMVADHAASGPSDDITATAIVGLDFEVRAFRHVVLRAGGRLVYAGFPGDTVATGGMMFVGGGLRF